MKYWNGVIKINHSGLRPIAYSGGITTTRQLMRELKDMEDNFITVVVGDREYIIDTKIATQAHSFRCGLVAQQYKSFNKLNYIFNFTMEIFTYAI